MSTTQLNVTISESSAKRVRKDCVEMGVTLAEYATVAFEQFLAKNIGQRRVHFAGKKKIVGRKVSL